MLRNTVICISSAGRAAHAAKIPIPRAASAARSFSFTACAIWPIRHAAKMAIPASFVMYSRKHRIPSAARSRAFFSSNTLHAAYIPHSTSG